MSIQTELSRIINAKAAIKAAIEGKGVTVPEATLLDGMAALIEGIESGTKVEIKTIVPKEDVTKSAPLMVEHGLGEVPKMVLIFGEDTPRASSYTLMFGLFFMESKFEYINSSSRNTFYNAYSYRGSSYQTGCGYSSQNSSTLANLISNEKVPISDATESYVTLCGIGNNASVNLAAGKTYRLILLGW